MRQMRLLEVGDDFIDRDRYIIQLSETASVGMNIAGAVEVQSYANSAWISMVLHKWEPSEIKGASAKAALLTVAGGAMVASNIMGLTHIQKTNKVNIQLDDIDVALKVIQNSGKQDIYLKLNKESARQHNIKTHVLWLEDYDDEETPAKDKCFELQTHGVARRVVDETEIFGAVFIDEAKYEAACLELQIPAEPGRYRVTNIGRSFGKAGILAAITQDFKWTTITEVTHTERTSCMLKATGAPPKALAFRYDANKNPIRMKVFACNDVAEQQCSDAGVDVPTSKEDGTRPGPKSKHDRGNGNGGNGGNGGHGGGGGNNSGGNAGNGDRIPKKPSRRQQSKNERKRTFDDSLGKAKKLAEKRARERAAQQTQSEPASPKESVSAYSDAVSQQASLFGFAAPAASSRASASTVPAHTIPAPPQEAPPPAPHQGESPPAALRTTATHPSNLPPTQPKQQQKHMTPDSMMGIRPGTRVSIMRPPQPRGSEKPPMINFLQTATNQWTHTSWDSKEGKALNGQQGTVRDPATDDKNQPTDHWYVELDMPELKGYMVIFPASSLLVLSPPGSRPQPNSHLRAYNLSHTGAGGSEPPPDNKRERIDPTGSMKTEEYESNLASPEKTRPRRRAQSRSPQQSKAAALLTLVSMFEVTKSEKAPSMSEFCMDTTPDTFCAVAHSGCMEWDDTCGFPGEGPDMTFTWWNVNGISKKIDAISNLAGQGALFCCETHCTPRWKTEYTRHLIAQQEELLVLFPQQALGSQRINEARSNLDDGVHAGVAAISSINEVCEAIPPDIHGLQQEILNGRIAGYNFFLQDEDGREVPVLFIVVYGYTGVHQSSDELLNMAESWAQMLPPHSACFIGGDFNEDMHTSDTLKRWSDMNAPGAELYDLAVAWGDIRPTNIRTEAQHGNGRRIDMVWTTPAGLNLVTDFSLGSFTASDHRPLSVTLSTERIQQTGGVRWRPRELPEPLNRRQEANPGRYLHPITPEEVQEAKVWRQTEWEQLFETARDQLKPKPVRRRALSTLFDIFGERWLWHAARRGGKIWSPKYYRGSWPLDVIQKPITRRHISGIDSQALENFHVRGRQYDKAMAKLQTTLHLQDDDERLNATWRNTANCVKKTMHRQLAELSETRQQALSQLVRPLKETVKEIKDKLANIRKHFNVRIRTLQLKSWREFTETSKVWEWIKPSWQSGQRTVPIMEVDGRLTTNFREITKAIIKCWGGIFAAKEIRYPMVAEMLLNAYPVTGNPPNFVEVSPTNLKRTLKRMKGCKGPDGWKISDLKKCQPGFDQLAELYKLMQEIHIVPHSFLQGDISLLEKGDKTVKKKKPEEHRPITVVSSLWRLYSSNRLEHVAFPLIELIARSLSVRGCRQGASTKDVTLLLSHLFEWARINEKLDRLSVVLYDLRKAFDSTPMNPDPNSPAHMGWEFLKKAGFDEDIRLTMMDMYANFERRYKVGGFLSEPVHYARDPTGCILQGCALSMFFMNVLTILNFTVEYRGLPEHAVRECFGEIVEMGVIPNNPNALDQLVSRICRVPNPEADVILQGYLDDMSRATTCPTEQLRGHECSQICTLGTGQEYNGIKCQKHRTSRPQATKDSTWTAGNNAYAGCVQGQVSWRDH